MLETTMLLPRCDDPYHIHAWLSDRMGSHRKQGIEYLHVHASHGDQTVLSVIHDRPIARLTGALPVAVPQVGAVIKFRAKVNPLRKQGGGPNPLRVAIPSSDVPGWLQRQINGATVDSCQVLHTGYEEFTKRKNSFHFWRVDVEGSLRVDSVEEFTRSILAGAGRMKCLGFGLIAIEGTMAFKVLGL